MQHATQLPARRIANVLGLPEPTGEQVAVIEAPLEPTLVVAGAGSGKTETMAARVVYLVANGLVAPEKVLGLTFTRKAAGEFQERVERRLAGLAATLPGITGPLAGAPTVATYNSYAASLVRDHGLLANIEPDNRLLSPAHQWQLAADLVESWTGELATERPTGSVVAALLGLSGQLDDHLVSPTQLASWLDHALAQLEPLPGRAGKPPPVAALNLIRVFAERRDWLDLVAEYRARKVVASLIDFNDQIAIAARLAREYPQIGAAERARYDLVLLDEYQDTSHGQAELLTEMFGKGHPVMAVGDPHQAIYGWRGASAAGLSQFPTRFLREDGSGAATRFLATSWRNDRQILDAANAIAEPLRSDAAPATSEPSAPEAPRLRPRPEAGSGAVSIATLETQAAEAEFVADWIAQRWRSASAPQGSVSAAVLCRTRSQFASLEASLRRRGIPVEVVGLGGLIAAPEVSDVIALLEAAFDPARGDAVLRLLTGPRVNLGARDLFALGSWARDLAAGDQTVAQSTNQGDNRLEPSEDRLQPSEDRLEPSEDRLQPSGDPVDARSLIDAIDRLPAPGQAATDGRELSDAARGRLQKLRTILRRLRKLGELSLPELVTMAETSLNLDIEVAVAQGLARVHPELAEQLACRGRANLDALREVAADFAGSTPRATPLAFLAWLDVARDQERGLEQPMHDLDPNAVQVITVHGAKGLEWDVVAVPGLVDGLFPSVAITGSRGAKAVDWLGDPGALPYPLRGDQADLPHFAWEKATDASELLEFRAAFRMAAISHARREERRLAYVAFTRAKRDLLATGFWWGEAQKPRELSVFLTELLELGSARCLAWAPEPEPDAENPLAARVTEAMWPPDEPPDSPRSMIRAAADQVRAAQATGQLGNPSGTLPNGRLRDADGNDLAELARMLLAERADPTDHVLELPPALSATALVHLAENREAFAQRLRRPLPSEPTIASNRGTRFHEWVERYFDPSGVLFDLDDLFDSEPEAADLDDLRNAFLATEWADRVPIAVEQRIYTTLGGVLVTSQIDAVFAEPRRGPNAVVVVDWKTGHPPRDPVARQAREVQLAIYRLAWSRWRGLPLDQVDAAFCYLATGETVRPARLMTEPELEALITGAGETNSRAGARDPAPGVCLYQANS